MWDTPASHCDYNVVPPGFCYILALINPSDISNWNEMAIFRATITVGNRLPTSTTTRCKGHPLVKIPGRAPAWVSCICRMVQIGESKT